MSPRQNPITRTRARLIQRTLGPPLAVLTALAVFGLLAVYLVSDGGCYGCEPERIAWRKAEAALMTVFVLQGLVAVLGPLVFGAGFYAYDKRSGVADATSMSPLSDKQRVWGEFMGIAVAPLTMLACFGGAALVPLVLGPIPLGAKFIGVQLVLGGITLLCSALAARCLCSERTRLSVALLIPLVWVGSLAVVHAPWSLLRMMLGGGVVSLTADIASLHGTAATTGEVFWISCASVLVVQAAALFALLGVRTPRTTRGMRRTLAVVAGFIAFQLGAFVLFAIETFPSHNMGLSISEYRFREGVMFFWLLGCVGTLALVTRLMPSPTERYRSALRGSLGGVDRARPNLYEVALAVPAMFGIALFVVSLLLEPSSGRYALDGGTVLSATIVFALQSCCMIAYYEFLATRTGARAPVWMVMSGVGLIAVLFFGLLAGVDESIVCLLPGASPMLLLTRSSPDVEVYVGAIAWLGFAMCLGALHTSKVRHVPA